MKSDLIPSMISSLKETGNFKNKLFSFNLKKKCMGNVAEGAFNRVDVDRITIRRRWDYEAIIDTEVVSFMNHSHIPLLNCDFVVKQRTIRSRDRSERHATGLEFLLNNNEAEIIRSKAFILSFKSDFIPFEDNYATSTYNYKAGSQKDQMGSLRLNKERPLDIYIVIIMQ